MSFSGKIKEELAEHVAKARHCNLAELTAILHMCGNLKKIKMVYVRLDSDQKIIW